MDNLQIDLGSFFRGADKLSQFPKFDIGQIITRGNLEGAEGVVKHYFFKGREYEITDYRWGKIWESDEPEYIYKLDDFFEFRESFLDGHVRVLNL